MSNATSNQQRRQTGRDMNTADMPLTQKSDIDLDLPVQHGESLINVAGENALNDDYQRELAFMEEPVTIRIEENSRSDFPETHVPVQVNGRGAEVMMNGKWTELTWVPINMVVTMKRKFVEVLARSKSESIKTQHDDANVERPRNLVQRRSSSNYPLSILRDDNPRGMEWLQRIMLSH